MHKQSTGVRAKSCSNAAHRRNQLYWWSQTPTRNPFKSEHTLLLSLLQFLFIYFTFRATCSLSLQLKTAQQSIAGPLNLNFISFNVFYWISSHFLKFHFIQSLLILFSFFYGLLFWMSVWSFSRLCVKHFERPLLELCHINKAALPHWNFSVQPDLSLCDKAIPKHWNSHYRQQNISSRFNPPDRAPGTRHNRRMQTLLPRTWHWCKICTQLFLKDILGGCALIR